MENIKVLTKINSQNMHEDIKISVIMSVYNTNPSWLRESILSILNQTFCDFEFIIVLDCPTDNSARIVKEFSRVDKRIIVIENKDNLGLTKNLNKAIFLAKGKYIARMDSDDISDKDRLKTQYDYMESHTNVAVTGSYIAMFSDGIISEIGMTDQLNDRDYREIQLLFDNAGVAHPTAFIRSGFIKEHSINYDERLKKSQDYGLWVDIVSAGGIIHTIPKILLKYRVHENQISQKQSSEQILSKRYLAKKQLKNLLDVVDEDAINLCTTITTENPKLNYIKYKNFVLHLNANNAFTKYYNNYKFDTYLRYILFRTLVKKITAGEFSKKYFIMESLRLINLRLIIYILLGVKRKISVSFILRKYRTFSRNDLMI